MGKFEVRIEGDAGELIISGDCVAISPASAAREYCDRVGYRFDQLAGRIVASGAWRYPIASMRPRGGRAVAWVYQVAPIAAGEESGHIRAATS